MWDMWINMHGCWWDREGKTTSLAISRDVKGKKETGIDKNSLKNSWLGSLEGCLLVGLKTEEKVRTWANAKKISPYSHQTPVPLKFTYRSLLHSPALLELIECKVLLESNSHRHQQTVFLPLLPSLRENPLQQPQTLPLSTRILLLRTHRSRVSRPTRVGTQTHRTLTRRWMECRFYPRKVTSRKVH
jgi:hypothetical protein